MPLEPADALVVATVIPVVSVDVKPLPSDLRPVGPAEELPSLPKEANSVPVADR